MNALNKPAARCGPAQAARTARATAVRPVAALKVSLIGPWLIAAGRREPSQSPHWRPPLPARTRQRPPMLNNDNIPPALR
jgi:hypothetical protein